MCGVGLATAHGKQYHRGHRDHGGKPRYPHACEVEAALVGGLDVHNKPCMQARR